MSEQKPDREDQELDRTERPASNAPGTPRWVIVFGIVLIALALIFLVLQVLGIGGEHGPGRHIWIVLHASSSGHIMA